MSLLQTRLNALSGALPDTNLAGIKRGIEKESLRVTPEGTLAQTPHSRALGAALTHSEITTDYSESLLEFITAPYEKVDDVLQHLDSIHRFTYANLDDEMLWVNSMPCMLSQDNDIPVGRYGDSNIGRMKTIYRLGLGHRYSRFMQSIAGIHYNFSLPDEFWRVFWEQEKSQQNSSASSLREFKDLRYFALIRNFRRHYWLLLYLFGAAPAVCRSFVANRKHNLVPIGADNHSLHTPYATSLRMGDLGYQSVAQQSLFVCYNNVRSYVGALCKAITKPYPAYEAIGIQDAQGNYQQLNTSILQIENEFYSAIRPKHPSGRDETALYALATRGVAYIEVRCLDLNPFMPVGIDATQMYFLDTFLLYCLLKDSPPSDLDEYRRIQENQQRMVYRGRDPELTLLNGGQDQSVLTWGGKILEEMGAVADLLDKATSSNHHQHALQQQIKKLQNPELTPSAKVLQRIREQDMSFFEFAMQQAQTFADFFGSEKLSTEEEQSFKKMAVDSLREQEEIERNDTLSFEDYLAKFYAQYSCSETGDCD